MKFITLREFQLHASDYLNELPITLTSHNLPVATVISPIDKSVVAPSFKVSKTLGRQISTEKPELNEGHPVTTAKCEAPGSNCKAYEQQYRITYFDSEGEHTEDRYLCQSHLKRTREMCEKVEEI